jgi:hypothetical protein
MAPQNTPDYIPFAPRLASGAIKVFPSRPFWAKITPMKLAQPRLAAAFVLLTTAFSLAAIAIRNLPDPDFWLDEVCIYWIAEGGTHLDKALTPRAGFAQAWENNKIGLEPGGYTLFMWAWVSASTSLPHHSQTNLASCQERHTRDFPDGASSVDCVLWIRLQSCSDGLIVQSKI